MLVSYRFGFGTFSRTLDFGTFFRYFFGTFLGTFGCIFWAFFLRECMFTLLIFILVGHVSTEIVHRKISA